MGRLGRVLLILLAIVALAIIVAGVSLTLFLNGSGLRSQVEATLTRALNRPVTIGHLELSLWSASLVAERMTIADDQQFGDHASAAQINIPGREREPFLEAPRVRMGIEVMPLLLTRQIRLTRFLFESPVVRLEHSADGHWNFTSLGKHQSPEQPHPGHTFNIPDLIVSRIDINDARILLTTNSASEPSQQRIYDRVNLEVHDFTLRKSFPFRLSANVPAGGSLKATGSIGPLRNELLEPTTAPGSAPIEQADTPIPFSAHIEANHLDLDAAGIVPPSTGVSALLEHVSLDLIEGKSTSQVAGANLIGLNESLHVTHVEAEGPRLAVLRKPSSAGTPATPRRANIWTQLLDHLTVDQAHVKLDSLTIGERTPDNTPAPNPLILQQVDATLDHWTPGNAISGEPHLRSPFTVTATAPGGGLVHATGRIDIPGVQTVNPQGLSNGGHTPFALDAHVSVKHLDLAASGLLAHNSAIAGSVSAEAQVGLDAGTITANGTAEIARLKLAHSGQPSPQPVTASFAMRQRSEDGGEAGDIDHATVSIGGGGGVIVHVSGSYRTGGASSGGTSINLQAHGEQMPVDSVEAFLPVVGVELPEGSRLVGGSLSINAHVAGPTTNLTIDGPVQLDNTRLAGFDLGSKLASVSRFTGGRIGSATVDGTNIRSLRLDLHAANGTYRTDNLAFDVAGIGPGTGTGSIGPGGTLDYKLSLKLTELIRGTDTSASGGASLARDLAAQLPSQLQGLARGAIDYLAQGPLKAGIPIIIGGTARHPTITPNLGALIPTEHPRR